MQPLRIVSYNVRYFAHALKGLTSTLRSMRGIAGSLASLEPLADVVALQEVETDSIRATLAVHKAHPTETQLERFMAELEQVFAARGLPCPYQAFYFRAHAYRVSSSANLYTTGLAILVRRGLIVDRDNADAPERITPAKSARAKQTRICAHLRIGGEQGLHVFNTHLSLPTPFAKQFWIRNREGRMGFGPNQLVEAQTLTRFIQREAAGERFVVVGDFNSAPGSPVYSYLTEQVGLVDLQAELQHVDVDDLRAWPTAGFMNLRMHLDHVFAGPRVEGLDLEESCRFGDRHGRFHGLSDHVPWVARVV